MTVFSTRRMHFWNDKALHLFHLTLYFVINYQTVIDRAAYSKNNVISDMEENYKKSTRYSKGKEAVHPQKLARISLSQNDSDFWCSRPGLHKSHKIVLIFILFNNNYYWKKLQFDRRRGRATYVHRYTTYYLYFSIIDGRNRLLFTCCWSLFFSLYLQFVLFLTAEVISI